MTRLGTALLLAISVLVAACGGETTPDSTVADTAAPIATTTTAAAVITTTTQPTPESTSIVISGFAFSGASRVAVGTTVTVTNQDGVTHTWTSDDDVWDSGSLGTDATFEFTFDQPGTYTYICTIHPTSMKGSITVEG